MIERTLGRSGLSVSPIGLGTWAIGGPWRSADSEAPSGWGVVDDEESIRALRRGLELGVTIFDTAPNYGCGHSERLLGRVLKGRRGDVVVATKFGYAIDEEKRLVSGTDLSAAGIRAACEASLGRLGTDYIDLYQCHVHRLEPDELETVRDVLEDLCREGKINWYGWSTHDVDGARRLAEGERCTAIEHVFNVLQRPDEVLQMAREAGLASLTMSPLAEGILAGKFRRDSQLPVDDHRRSFDFDGREGHMLDQLDRIAPILVREGRTMAQAALAWLLARSETIIPIPGFKTVAQVEENIAAAELGPLSEDEMEEIDAALDAP